MNKHTYFFIIAALLFALGVMHHQEANAATRFKEPVVCLSADEEAKLKSLYQQKYDEGVNDGLNLLKRHIEKSCHESGTVSIGGLMLDCLTQKS